MREIRIDRKAFIAMLRNAGVIPQNTLQHHVKALIVWENNTTEPLFSPTHGGDGLLLEIEEPAVEVRAPYDHACVGCGRFFTRMALSDGRGAYLGWCVDCDSSKDAEILEKIGGRGGAMPGSGVSVWGTKRLGKRP